jgi:hypothetical protein
MSVRTNVEIAFKRSDGGKAIIDFHISMLATVVLDGQSVA